MLVVKDVGHTTSSNFTNANTVTLWQAQAEKKFSIENIPGKRSMFPQPGGSEDLLRFMII
jgi:hypothetical protein